MEKKVKHATVNTGGYTIPLIGVPASATKEKCDLCGGIFHTQEITLVGTKFLCIKCLKKP